MSGREWGTTVGVVWMGRDKVVAGTLGWCTPDLAAVVGEQEGKFDGSTIIVAARAVSERPPGSHEDARV